MKLLVFLTICFLSSGVFAWGCATHQYICALAGLQDLNCCAADAEKVPAMYYHHCQDNAPNCLARVKAAEYLATRPEISAHLYADALSPPHWLTNQADCHSKYEAAVDAAVKKGGDWKVATKCPGVVTLLADPAYLDMVAQSVKESVNITRIPGKTAISSKDVNDSWMTPITNWLPVIALVVIVLSGALYLLK